MAPIHDHCTNEMKGRTLHGEPDGGAEKSQNAEEAQAHFGPLSMFVSEDMPASSIVTRKKTRWHPTGPDSNNRPRADRLLAPKLVYLAVIGIG
jgi:hypothetical protein